MSKKSADASRTARAAAFRAEQERKERMRRLGLIALVVVVLGAIVAAGLWYSSDGGGSDGPTTTVDVPASVGDHALVIGAADAPVKVTVFEDFQCPFCRQFEMASRDFLHEYAAKGKVQVTYRPFNLLSQLPYSSRALDAFIAVLDKGTPEQALALHDRFFDEQPYEQQSDSVSEKDIAGWVEDTGAGRSVVDAAGEDHQDWFEAARTAALDAGVQGTPTVLVDGKKFGEGMSVTQMADALEKQIAGAS